jgi:hypothetical protein
MPSGICIAGLNSWLDETTADPEAIDPNGRTNPKIRIRTKSKDRNRHFIITLPLRIHVVTIINILFIPLLVRLFIHIQAERKNQLVKHVTTVKPPSRAKVQSATAHEKKETAQADAIEDFVEFLKKLYEIQQLAKMING